MLLLRENGQGRLLKRYQRPYQGTGLALRDALCPGQQQLPGLPKQLR